MRSAIVPPVMKYTCSARLGISLVGLNADLDFIVAMLGLDCKWMLEGSWNKKQDYRTALMGSRVGAKQNQKVPGERALPFVYFWSFACGFS